MHLPCTFTQEQLDTQNLESPLGLLATATCQRVLVPSACFPKQLRVHICKAVFDGKATEIFPAALQLPTRIFCLLFPSTTKLTYVVQATANLAEPISCLTKNRILVTGKCIQRKEVAIKFIKIKKELMIPADTQCLSSVHVYGFPFLSLPCKEAKRMQMYRDIPLIHLS